MHIPFYVSTFILGVDHRLEYGRTTTGFYFSVKYKSNGPPHFIWFKILFSSCLLSMYCHKKYIGFCRRYFYHLCFWIVDTLTYLKNCCNSNNNGSEKYWMANFKNISQYYTTTIFSYIDNHTSTISPYIIFIYYLCNPQVFS